MPDGDHHYVSFVHGDLNAANILVDDRGNVWVIDFFHSGPGHVLKDLAKLENDLLYILTPVDDDQLPQAISLTRALLEVEDLQAPLRDHVAGLQAPQLVRAWSILRLLRRIGVGCVERIGTPYSSTSRCSATPFTPLGLTNHRWRRSAGRWPRRASFRNV